MLIFFSGCINSNVSKSEINIQASHVISDLAYKVEVYPTTVKSGKDLKLKLYLESNKNLKDFTVYFYDTCVFSGSSLKKTFDLEKNSPKIISYKLKAGNVELPSNCQISFKMSYEGEYEASQDIVVLSSSEYEQRSRSGTLNEFLPKFEETTSPLYIALTFSELQPFKSGEEIRMKIDYENRGSGDLKIENLEITVPNSLEPESCDDFKINGQKLILKKPIEFFGKKAAGSVCVFKTKTDVPISMEKMKISGKYKYTVRDYINVEVIP